MSQTHPPPKTLVLVRASCPATILAPAEEIEIEMLLDNLDDLKNGLVTLLPRSVTNLTMTISMKSQPLSPSSTSQTSSVSSDGKDPLPSKKSLIKRGCPSAQNQTPPQMCRNLSCKSLDVVEDADQGCVVCIQCGLIQTSSVFENASTDAVFHGGVSRIVVHRYSRIAILRGILLSLQGETRLVLDHEQTEKLRSFFPTGEPPENAIAVKRAIRILHLPRKLTHHATTIWFRLWQGHTPNPSESEIRDVLHLFRALENVWDRLPLENFVRNHRKKFLSLPLTWKFLCEKLHFDELGTIMDELQIKNNKNAQKQRYTLETLFVMSKK
jgi:transcription initiation factor TFIIIB Brf1 subunit/transcription initiation factor TFIIB